MPCSGYWHLIDTVLIGGLHPQPKETENTNGWSPIIGSFERRWLHLLLINRKLKNIAKKMVSILSI